MEIKKEYMMAYALKNAIEHEGKAIPGSVISGLFNVGLEKDKIGKIMPEINSVVKEINSFEAEEQKLLYEKYKDLVGHRAERQGLPELEDVPKTGIITRFSPSSSASAFHIGHILTGMPASLYVKKYGGKFYLRIEDTNPEKTVKECYESFPKEAEWIFGNVTEFYAQSDRINKYYAFAEELLSKGFAFVCTCRKEENDEDIPKRREPCKCRNNSVKENLNQWKNMLDKKGFGEGEAVLRFKSRDTNLANPALVDFPLARINLTSHPKQGKKYRVWPLMNLCVTYDDMEQKCTHIIRGKEHRDNSLRQEMIFDALKIKKPHTYFLGRYKFTDLEISKTKITELIKKGEFSGWDDIRLPLARIFKKRGYQPLAFEEYVVKRGISEVDKVINKKDFFEVLNQFNRDILKEKAKKADFEKTNEKNSNAIILMPDASKVYGKTNAKPKENEIFYFVKMGYAKFNGLEKKKQLFWFTHE
jgi:glutamyl-tRNA synthetase